MSEGRRGRLCGCGCGGRVPAGRAWNAEVKMPLPLHARGAKAREEAPSHQAPSHQACSNAAAAAIHVLLLLLLLLLYTCCCCYTCAAAATIHVCSCPMPSLFAVRTQAILVRVRADWHCSTSNQLQQISSSSLRCGAKENTAAASTCLLHHDGESVCLKLNTALRGAVLALSLVQPCACCSLAEAPASSKI